MNAENPGSKKGPLAALSPVLKLVGSDNFAKIILIASLCAIFYSVGAATILFQVFPYKQLRTVAEGFRARLALEKDNLPIGFDGWIDEALPAPETFAGAGDEPILIGGGPGRRLDLCPTHGCLAWVIDRKGNVLHTWEIDFEKIIAADTVHVGRLNTTNLSPIGMALMRDGSLVVSFHGRNLFPYQVGIAKVSRDGEIEWVRDDLSHHWLAMRGDGVILAPFAEVAMNAKHFGATDLPLRCRTGAVYDEGVRAISPDGKTLFEKPFLELFSAAQFPGLFYSMNDGCDPLHVNSVDVADAAIAAANDGVEEGDILVSVRELSAIVLLDKDASRIKKAIIGRTAAQHSAVFAPEGGVLAFDNRGGAMDQGGSRVAWVGFNNETPKTVFPAGNVKLRSQYQGHVDPGAGGRLLVTSSSEGLVYEIDGATGGVLWRFQSSEPTGAYKAEFGVKPEKPFARYGLTAAYYVSDAGFLETP